MRKTLSRGRVAALLCALAGGAGAVAWAKDAGAPEVAPAKKTVTLSFSTRPKVRARVYYGRKLLGETPFSVEWKRDSGPLDLAVRAPGYLTVNTRAYTFRDEDIAIKMTPREQANTLFGYKKPLPPDGGSEDLPPDAGVARPPRR